MTLELSAFGAIRRKLSTLCKTRRLRDLLQQLRRLPSGKTAWHSLPHFTKIRRLTQIKKIIDFYASWEKRKRKCKVQNEIVTQHEQLCCLASLLFSLQLCLSWRPEGPQAHTFNPQMWAVETEGAIKATLSSSVSLMSVWGPETLSQQTTNKKAVLYRKKSTSADIC